MKGLMLKNAALVTQLLRNCVKESLAPKYKALSVVSYTHIKYDAGKEVSRAPVGK